MSMEEMSRERMRTICEMRRCVLVDLIDLVGLPVVCCAARSAYKNCRDLRAQKGIYHKITLHTKRRLFSIGDHFSWHDFFLLSLLISLFFGCFFALLLLPFFSMCVHSKLNFSHSRNVNWMLKYANYIIVWWRFMFHTSNLENKAEQQKKIRPMMKSNNNYGTKYAWAESTQKKQKKKSTKHTQRLNSTN